MKTHAAVFLCALFLGARAQQEQPVHFDLPVHFDTLSNGLKCIIVQDTSVAVVSCRLYYFVGSMYEGPGSSGLSHMYEHMMFKGTTRLGTTSYKKEKPYMDQIDLIDNAIHKLTARGIPETDSSVVALRTQAFALLDKQRKFIVKDKIWSLYQENGGTQLNAWTGDDMTAYMVTLPRNKVELFYWIESDRMSNPVLREFFSERDVVTEERRMRYENRPLGNYYENLFARFYIAHPYRLPTIGWMSDIRAYSRKRLQEHVQRYYTPDNALLVLNGNVDPNESLKSIKHYFGGIHRAKEPKQEVVTREPDAPGQTRFTMFDDAEPRIDIFFHTPGYPDSDLYLLDIVEGVLNGVSGRLYQRLVLQENLCTNAGAGNSFRLHNGYFHVWGTLTQSADPARVETIIAEELDKLGTAPPSEREIQRVKNGITYDFAQGLKSLEGLSDRLAWFERLGSWKDLEEYPQRIMDANAAAIPAAVKRHFNLDKATIGVLQPKKEMTAVEGKL